MVDNNSPFDQISLFNQLDTVSRKIGENYVLRIEL